MDHNSKFCLIYIQKKRVIKTFFYYIYQLSHFKTLKLKRCFFFLCQWNFFFSLCVWILIKKSNLYSFIYIYTHNTVKSKRKNISFCLFESKVHLCIWFGFCGCEWVCVVCVSACVKCVCWDFLVVVVVFFPTIGN